MRISNRRTRARANGISLALSGLFLVMIGTGCGVLDRFKAETNNVDLAPAEANTATQNDNSAASSIDESVPASGLCSNQYYPVDPTLIRSYEITGSGPAKYTLTQQDVRDTGFKEVRTFDSGTIITNNWLCTPDGLRTAEFTNTGVMQSGRFQMETVKSAGVTIPHKMELADLFESLYDVRVKLKAGPVTANATGTVTISNKVVSVDEPVDVGGEQYDAVKIDSTIAIVITVNGRRMESAKVSMSNWYGKGIGLVQQETGGTFGKSEIRLVSIEKK